MNSNPKVSIIVPVYKVEKYLDKCVNSIVNQTYENLEIILVDDGSPDNSGDMCDKWAQKDERIRVIHKPNGGLSDARNAGMNIATGEYIGFVDSDDWIEPDMYQGLVDNAVAYDADISRCGIFIDDETTGGQIIHGEFQELKVLDKTELLKGLVMGGYIRGVVWNKIYKREVIDEFRFSTDDGASEDIMFNNRISSNVNVYVSDDRPKYHYIRRVGAITVSEFGYGAFSIVRAMESFLEQYKDDEEIYARCIKGYTDAAFTVLSGVITNQKCVEKYDELRNGILSFKKRILFGGHHSTKDKVKTVLLFISPKLYNAMIRKIRNV